MVCRSGFGGCTSVSSPWLRKPVSSYFNSCMGGDRTVVKSLSHHQASCLLVAAPKRLLRLAGQRAVIESAFVRFSDRLC